MKKLFTMTFALLSGFGCSEENSTPVATQTPPAGCQGEAQLSEVSNLNMTRSPYDFSSIVNLRRSILQQAEVEGLDMNTVVEFIDNLAEKIIDENMEELSKCETEEDADKAMMKLFMKVLGAKPLGEIMGIKAK